MANQHQRKAETSALRCVFEQQPVKKAKQRLRKKLQSQDVMLEDLLCNA